MIRVVADPCAAAPAPARSILARHLARREARRPDPVVEGHRRRLLAGLRGSVLEIGCGEGRNFRHYPPGVRRVVAVEPDPEARAAAARAAADAGVHPEIIAGVAEALPVRSGAFDVAVCVWVLCTVADQRAALAEIRRALRPHGELRFYEHVRGERVPMRCLQRAVDAAFWPGMLGGCHTARDTEAAIRAAGFRIEWLERFTHASRWLTLPAAPQILGAARA